MTHELWYIRLGFETIYSNIYDKKSIELVWDDGKPMMW